MEREPVDVSEALASLRAAIMHDLNADVPFSRLFSRFCSTAAFIRRSAANDDMEYVDERLQWISDELLHHYKRQFHEGSQRAIAWVEFENCA